MLEFMLPYSVCCGKGYTDPHMKAHAACRLAAGSIMSRVWSWCKLGAVAAECCLLEC